MQTGSEVTKYNQISRKGSKKTNKKGKKQKQPSDGNFLWHCHPLSSK